MGAALRLLVTQSGHSLDYGVQKVCVPKTSDLRTLVAGGRNRLAGGFRHLGDLDSSGGRTPNRNYS